MLSELSTQLEKIRSENFLNHGTILSEFLNKRVLQYEEPQRKGKSKGATIGYGRKKVWAVFLASLGFNPIQVYQFLIDLGGSYDSIRHWFTEPKFKRMVLQFQDEISAQFVGNLVNLSETTDTTLYEGEKPSVWKIFGRAENYGDELTLKILSAIIDRLNESQSLLLLQTASTVISAFFDNFPESNPLKNFDRTLEKYLDTYTLTYIYHKLKSHQDILHPSPFKSQRLLRMFRKHIGHTAIEVPDNLLELDASEHIIEDDSWVSDDIRFLAKISIMLNGKRIGAKKENGRPRKRLPEGT